MSFGNATKVGRFSKNIDVLLKSPPPKIAAAKNRRALLGFVSSHFRYGKRAIKTVDSIWVGNVSY